MFRWPQAASEPILKLPIQLHAAVGPSLVIVPELRIDLRPDVAKKVEESPSGGWGVDLRGGLAWNFSSRVALFAEYRYIRYHVGFKEKVCLTLRCVLINAVIPFPGGERWDSTGGGRNRREQPISRCDFTPVLTLMAGQRGPTCTARRSPAAPLP